MMLYAWPLRLAVCAVLVSSVLPAQALTSCVPKGERGKVLKSKDDNDVDSYAGSAWSLLRVRPDGRFLSGVLATPRGSVLPSRVFVIADEWNCS